MLRSHANKATAAVMTQSLVAGGASQQVRHYTDAKTVRAPHKFEQFSYPENAAFMENLLTAFEKDAESVDASWRPILSELASADPDQALLESFQRPVNVLDETLSDRDRINNMKLAWMIRAYEVRGHHMGTYDPLGMYQADLDNTIPVALEPSAFGFSEKDLSREFQVNFGASFGGMITSGTTKMKLSDICAKLREVYCGDIGFEFMDTGYFDVRNWFRNEIFSTSKTPAPEVRLRNLNEVVKACGFEKFLHTKYSTHKRFGLDGAESLIPAMNAAIDEAANMGMESCYMGMPHRGRLNVLVNVCGKPLQTIFNEFEGRTPADEVIGTGDVKYHLGITKTRTTASGKVVNVNLMANPSHLECVNPLVIGRTRQRQHISKDKDLTKNVPLLLHGDAAFSGQGVCYETMGLSDLECFHVGGTIHIVVNNQIGFTTDPIQSRSAKYCTDLAKVNNAPVIHVNGDNVDQVVRAARMAARFRQTFKRDIIIDLVCYRRNGHNESDVPMFTQPLMYSKIKTQPVLVDKYGAQLVDDEVITKDEFEKRVRQYSDVVKKAHSEAMTEDSNFVKVHDAEKEGIKAARIEGSKTTGLKIDQLVHIGERLTTLPEGFKPHPKAEGPIKKRREAVEAGVGIEWCLAEQMALGAMAQEGFHVRLTGQDVERGTFSQRHAAFTDVETGDKFFPLKTISEKQGTVRVANSSLSEFGVCGFETGYAVSNKDAFVMWEAQFGDFANGAQVIFDQFLSSGEAKWNKQSGLTISLPHGYDGQGPEHSSSRVERFLQMTDDSHQLPADFNIDAEGQALLDLCENRIAATNWQVCYPSTPANYFHMLRRQLARDFRKPLIFLFAKSGVRDPNLSTMAEMGPNTAFNHTYVSHASGPADKMVDAEIERVYFCSGQVERKLKAVLAARNKDIKDDSQKLGRNVAFVRLEQIAPFPFEQVAQAMRRFDKATDGKVEFSWLQEEAKNMGAWSYIRPRFREILTKVFGKTEGAARINYVGRIAAASPAVGQESMHNKEEKAIFDTVFRELA